MRLLPYNIDIYFKFFLKILQKFPLFPVIYKHHNIE